MGVIRVCLLVLLLVSLEVLSVPVASPGQLKTVDAGQLLDKRAVDPAEGDLQTSETFLLGWGGGYGGWGGYGYPYGGYGYPYGGWGIYG